MQITQISRIATTTGDSWTNLIDVACTVTSLVLAARSMGESAVSVRIQKADTTTAFIVPSDALPEGGSARLRLPSVVLEEDDKLQVKSTGQVDWVASAIVMVEEEEE